MPSFTSGSIQATPLNKVLSGNVSVPAANPKIRDMVNDPSLQTVNIGYGILSENPETVNSSIQDNSAVSHQVFLTRAIDCTLEGQLDPTSGALKNWESSNELATHLVSATDVSNNGELFDAQLNVMRAAIEIWLEKTCFSSSYASQLVSLPMEKYDIQIMSPLLDDDSAPLSYVTRTTRALTGMLKANIENNGSPVVLNSNYECATTFNVPYNVFNKRSTYETMVAVNSIIESPSRVLLDGNYISLITGLSNTTNATVTDSTIVDSISQFVRCQYSVYVDCFTSTSSTPPPLLELIFNTDFYFNAEEVVTHNPGLRPVFKPSASLSTYNLTPPTRTA